MVIKRSEIKELTYIIHRADSYPIEYTATLFNDIEINFYADTLLSTNQSALKLDIEYLCKQEDIYAYYLD